MIVRGRNESSKTDSGNIMYLIISLVQSLVHLVFLVIFVIIVIGLNIDTGKRVEYDYQRNFKIKLATILS